MTNTPSTMLPLGTIAPEFALPDTDFPVDGGGAKLVRRADYDGKPLVVMFICNHCPFVKHLADDLARFGVECMERGVGVVAVSSNDVHTHPEDAPERMRGEKRARRYPFPYLYDESQSVAKAYRAACTPDFYLFDAKHALVYRGQYDDSRPGKGVITGADLRGAVDALVRKVPISAHQRPSLGCNIKWRGISPAY